MKKQFTATLGAAAIAALLSFTQSAVTAQVQDKPEAGLKAAMDKETLQGDLKGAIEQYKKIAQSKDRSIAARALIRMAECYSKLGDAESRNVYERVVREFSDQKESVATARARLGGAAAVASAKGDRAVWTAKVYPHGRVSPDGRLISSRDQSSGGLMVHDIEANANRTLTPPPANYYAQWTRHSAFSRDGKQVVYEWWDGNRGWRLAFRIAALPGIGLLEPREFFLSSDELTSSEGLTWFDWSPDGKWIAAAIRRKDRTGQIALIAVADGSFRVLKSMDWNVPERIFFSPDSRYIAYDLPAGDRIAQRDVFVLAIDGSREIPAVVHSANEAVMGWSPDGTRLLFSSDRTGAVGLWALPFANGKALGTPELLKSDIGSVVSMGLTAAGALYVHKRISTRDVVIAPIDLDAGKLLGPPVGFTQGFVFDSRNLSWSPDGKYLAYAGEDGAVIAIRSVATGQVRLLPHAMNYVQALNWSPDGRSLLTMTRATDLKGREGIFQIDVQSGEVTAVVLGAVGAGQWSPDGKKIYYNRGKTIERDLATGAERDVNREVQGPLSPDGQYFAGRRQDPSTKTASLLLVPLAGGQPRELLRLTEPEMFGPGVPTWTPDSRAIIFVKNSDSRRELWLVPVAGDPAHKLDIDPDLWMNGAIAPGSNGFSLSPDGRSIAFQMGKSADEVWALENFLPKAAAKR